MVHFAPSMANWNSNELSTGIGWHHSTKLNCLLDYSAIVLISLATVATVVGTYSASAIRSAQVLVGVLVQDGHSAD